MKTHNAIIYHCLCCGSVVHSEPDLEQPNCCGQKMVKAAAETLYGDEDAVVEPVQATPEAIPPEPPTCPHPR
jgi:hypothetical protein